MPRGEVRRIVAQHIDAAAADVSRLLYRGEPWSRRGDGNTLNQHEWRRRNDEVCGAILRELRPKQWLKNGLVFLGLVYALRFTDLDLILRATLAVAAFCAI